MTRTFCLIATLAALLLGAGPALAQDSIETLPLPSGPSSGETLPGDTVAQAESPADGAEPAAPAEPEKPKPCGTQPITIARMQWPSAQLLTEIHSRVLSIAFKCEVHIQEGDMATTGSSMGANGQPAVAPEMWITRIAEIWNSAIKAQEVRQAGASYAEQVFEGWFVPAYAVEKWPEITTIEGLKVHATEMGGGKKPRFITCPGDWGYNILNRNMLRANGLDALFEVVEPANRFELDTLIAEAVGKQEPILFYYWQPNAILSQFEFRDVALGSFNKDNFLCMGRVACATPLPSSFAPDPVIIAVGEWVHSGAPQVASYFQRAKMPIAEMNAMMQQLSETGATVETVAARFIDERGAIWRPWAGLPADGSPAPDAEAEEDETAPPAQQQPQQSKPRPQPEPEPEPEAPKPPAMPPQSLT